MTPQHRIIMSLITNFQCSFFYVIHKLRFYVLYPVLCIQFGLGPKEATENKRDFSDEQLNAGQSIIGLQMGTNRGASQAGMSFGKTRHIVD